MDPATLTTLAPQSRLDLLEQAFEGRGWAVFETADVPPLEIYGWCEQGSMGRYTFLCCNESGVSSFEVNSNGELSFPQISGDGRGMPSPDGIISSLHTSQRVPDEEALERIAEVEEIEQEFLSEQFEEWALRRDRVQQMIDDPDPSLPVELRASLISEIEGVEIHAVAGESITRTNENYRLYFCCSNSDQGIDLEVFAYHNKLPELAGWEHEFIDLSGLSAVAVNMRQQNNPVQGSSGLAIRFSGLKPGRSYRLFVT